MAHRLCEDRPWGAYEVLDHGPHHQVKRIEVRPGHRLSYQLHSHRAEHWFVVAGSAAVRVGEIELNLGSGQAIDIPIGTPHRLANPGDIDLVLIEIQSGDYFGEDDIVRLEDDYGRVDSTALRPSQ